MPPKVSICNFNSIFFIYKIGYPESFRNDGILGSMLPDVRYITKQDRKLTHLKESFKDAKTYGQLFDNILGDTENKISSPDGSSEKIHHFRMGFAFHIALDQWWPKQIYFPSEFEKIGACLKLLDDILLASEVDKINMEDELALPYKIKFLDLSDALIEKWYNFVFGYIKKRPTLQNIKEMLVEGELFDEKTSEEISREVNKIFNESDVRNKLQDMYESFSWKEISKNQI
ncbi:MAG: hypothetical protein COV84_00930 [Candidatus Portnoybacteria bacterium CG11_big_fil_rev_8_21_14_0_20_40_15]|uniref:Phospholipase C/D domain-containing protein n=2 Tax=Candidatus Portnoyibacteriota TaxID=1817913 RepID=A0A2H0KTL4_9BACT|nr:MAG: hypothetical protein COV84_00930 [Candidatus Portnoybacteria bacterium CG11_big_fil_rev_8_21_14_0_20_40_15]PJA64477.1 MAG: hypothetical protein CO159_02875 [Candidatus Portnoybacteria bacterium CG_4_9_14_3_um_filter_40_10]